MQTGGQAENAEAIENYGFNFYQESFNDPLAVFRLLIAILLMDVRERLSLDVVPLLYQETKSPEIGNILTVYFNRVVRLPLIPYRDARNVRLRC